MLKRYSAWNGFQKHIDGEATRFLFRLTKRVNFSVGDYFYASEPVSQANLDNPDLTIKYPKETDTYRNLSEAGFMMENSTKAVSRVIGQVSKVMPVFQAEVVDNYTDFGLPSADEAMRIFQAWDTNKAHAVSFNIIKVEPHCVPKFEAHLLAANPVSGVSGHGRRGKFNARHAFDAQAKLMSQMLLELEELREFKEQITKQSISGVSAK